MKFHPTVPIVIANGYEAPIPKNVAACRQKSQDAEVKVCYDVRCKRRKVVHNKPPVGPFKPPVGHLTVLPIYFIMYSEELEALAIMPVLFFYPSHIRKGGSA